MESEKKTVSIRTKMFFFIIIIVLLAAFGTSAIAFTTGANQIDRYYKQNTADNARNFASLVDAEYIAKLRASVETPEYQELREKAEEDDDEAVIEAYLREHDLWENYSRIRDMLTDYLSNMKGIKYLYLVAPGGPDALYDMYLIDDKENPLYETGYYEEREKELLGIDITRLPEPTISNGDWGWLCSDFKPVYDQNGQCVCIVGCDIGMDDVMAERQRLMMILVIGTLILVLLILMAAMYFINGMVVEPLNAMTREMKKFSPSENLSYEDSGVINIGIRNKDEIGEIYRGIRDMQIKIIDYLKNMFALEKEKEKAEIDLKHRDEKIEELSIESYRDALTGVGNKAAYNKKTEEINLALKEGSMDFALVMVDINNLKQINDEFGHKSGDLYIKGCCQMICDAFKHSPVYRIGGDEFVVILSGKDYERRMEIVEQLKKDFETSYNRNDSETWEKYSAAVGIAEHASDDSTVELVFRRADARMYKDKEEFKKKYGGSAR